MTKKREYMTLLKQALGDRLTIRESAAPNEVYLSLHEASLSTLPELCSLLTKSLKAHFTTLVANDERTLNGRFFLYYVFSVPSADLFLILQVPVDPRHMEVPSISTLFVTAN